MKTFEYVELTEAEMNETVGGGKGGINWFLGVFGPKKP